MKKRGFTIVELLTVMSIIIILISLLVPALNQVKRISKNVVQTKQINSIDVALEMYQAEQGEYPDSDELGGDSLPYCGAMKLAEAIAGADLNGFHKDSLFRSDLTDKKGNLLYQIPGQPALPNKKVNESSRKGPYLPTERIETNRIGNGPAGEYEGLYEITGYNSFKDYDLVICDVYKKRIQGTSLKSGMPILYYKAKSNGSTNPSILPDGSNNGITKDDTTNYYDYKDNDEIVKLGVPWEPSLKHPMDSTETDNVLNDGLGTTETFYYKINNDGCGISSGRPYRYDSYILISAGYDGLYGTNDDIMNF